MQLGMEQVLTATAQRAMADGRTGTTTEPAPFRRRPAPIGCVQCISGPTCSRTSRTVLHPHTLSSFHLISVSEARIQLRLVIKFYASRSYAVFESSELRHEDEPLSRLISAFFMETKVPAIHDGDRAQVRLMADTAILEGRVEGVSRGIAQADVDAVGRLANVNPNFTWVRLAQRVPVCIALEKVPSDLRLGAGLTATLMIAPRETNK